jgi:Arc/MetJ-type ribon-helix-helix transcriptional regulator
MTTLTIAIPDELAREVQEAVAAGLAGSTDELGRKALATEVARLREDRLARDFEDAARDPMFLDDVREVGEGFRSADAESARLIPRD